MGEIEENKSFNTSMSFILDLEKILNYLVENDIYMAQMNKTSITYMGEIEDTLKGKRQVFEIIRKVD